ncbi:MAG: T9SS type A sorting domain-containing protein [Saprospiraceae bacterium]
MPSSKTITICAKDLDAGSYDNCTEQGNLKFSFTEDPADSCKTFTCDDVLFNLNELIEIMIWVTDEAGNQDFCSTYIRLQNGSEEACKDISQAAYSVSGIIETEAGQLVENVKVSIEAQGFSFTSSTTNSGKYIFNNIPGHENYRIRPYKNDDPVNGLSTLDIVEIQKHILGIQRFTSPFQMLAADINKSNSVTAVDIIELRKIILGYSDQMPNNTSWRFVDSDYQFADIYQPWGASEMRPMQVVNEDKDNMNFIGVKVGDVNGSAKANGLNPVEVRSNEQWSLTTNNYQLIPNVVNQVPVYASDLDKTIAGAQFTMSGSDVHFIGLSSGTLDIEPSMFAVLQPGLMTVTLDQRGKDITGTLEPMFYIQVETVQPASAEEAIQIGSLVTAAEAYRPNLKDVLGVGWESGGLDHAVDGWFMYQNYPNPFSDQTMIGIIAPHSGDAQLEIYDLQGKLILDRKLEMRKGYNEVRIAGKDLNLQSGVLYVKLRAEDASIQQKILKVQ